MEEYKSRKQSLYFEAMENQENVKKSFEERQFSEQNESRPFRVRSGTDISNSLISARFKFRRSQSKINQDQEPIIEQEKDGANLGSNIALAGGAGDGEKIFSKRSEIFESQDPVMFDLYDPLRNPRLDIDPGDPEEAEEFEDCFSRKTSNLEIFEMAQT